MTSEYGARMQTRNFSYNLLRITIEMPCVYVRGPFGSTNFHECTVVHIYTYIAVSNIMRLTPDPVLLFVTLSIPWFLTLSHTSDAVQVSLLVSLSVKEYISLSRDSNPLSHDPKALNWTKHVDQTSESGLYDENDPYNENIPCVVVCSGLTLLSTIFQSYYKVSGCDRELNAHFYCVVSLKYHAPDTWHDTTPSHIILTLPRPVLALPRKPEC